jgi:hypothetical protein
MALSALFVLGARADARGYLWHCGEYNFDQAVEPLLDYAEACGIEPPIACHIINSAFAEYSE